LQRIANQLLNAFANIKKKTKSYASSLNDRSRIEGRKEQVINTLVISPSHAKNMIKLSIPKIKVQERKRSKIKKFAFI
jgi:hypothetical protein